MKVKINEKEGEQPPCRLNEDGGGVSSAENLSHACKDSLP